MGSRFGSQVLGTFGEYGVLSFNGNKMITTSGGGALICRNAEDANNVMWYATQARDASSRCMKVLRSIPTASKKTSSRSFLRECSIAQSIGRIVSMCPSNDLDT